MAGNTAQVQDMAKQKCVEFCIRLNNPLIKACVDMLNLSIASWCLFKVFVRKDLKVCSVAPWLCILLTKALADMLAS